MPARFPTQTCIVFLLGCVATLTTGCDRNLSQDNAPLPTQPLALKSTTVAEPLAPPDPAKLQEDGLAALAAGDVDRAERLSRTAILVAPDDPPIVFLRALVLGKRHRFHEAIRMLDRLALTESEARLPVLGQTAEWMVLAGDWTEAETRYLAVLEAVPDAALAHRNLAMLLNRQGRRFEAAQHLHALCRLGDIDESELRALLRISYPFAGDAIKETFEPIESLGKSRREMGQGNADKAIAELLPITEKHTPEWSLLGRLYAHKENLEALSEWAAEPLRSESATADAWFARGVYEAHQGNHRAAVNAFCEVVLRDQTDSQAYLLMSRSLSELKADDKATEVAKRSESIEQTHAIGRSMAESDARDLQTIARLAGLLEELHRPLESLAWQAVQVAYGRSDLSDADSAELMAQINRRRMDHLHDGAGQASKAFILCGVDVDALSANPDAGKVTPPSD